MSENSNRNDDVEKEKNVKKSRWISPAMSGFVVKFSKQIIKKTFWSRRFLILDETGKLWYFKNDNPKSSAKKNRPIQVRGRRFWRSTFKGYCIKVEKYPKPFYFHINDKCLPKNRTKSEVYEEWISKMIEVGGKYCGNLLVDEYLTLQNASISTKLIKDWKQEQIFEWLSHLPCENDRTFLDLYSENFLSLRDGSSLLQMGDDEKKFSSIGIKNPIHKSLLRQYLKSLKPRTKFNTKFQVVFRKLFRILHPTCQQSPNREEEEEEGEEEEDVEHVEVKFVKVSQIEKFSTYLSDVEKILDTYLYCEYGSPEDRLMKNIFEGDPEEEEEKESEGEKEKKGRNEKSYGYLHHFYYKDRIPPIRNQRNRKGKKAGSRKRVKEEKKNFVIQVKIIISHFPFVNEEFVRRKDFGAFLNPTVYECPFEDLKEEEQHDPIHVQVKKLKHDLLFRAGLVIGPWYFEWEGNSLVIPRRMEGQFWKYCQTFNDLGLLEYTDKKDVKRLMKKISSICCEYNTQKVYDPISCNNQHFINNFFRQLGVTIGDVFQRYLNLMKRGGRCGHTVVPVTDFFCQLYKFQNFPSGVLEIANHTELDLLVNLLQEVDVISLRTDFVQEMGLLESFDIAFQIRNHRYPNRGLCYKPIDAISTCFHRRSPCPFNRMNRVLRSIFVWKNYNHPEHGEMERRFNERSRVVGQANRGFDTYASEIGLSMHHHAFSMSGHDENIRIRLETESVSSPHTQIRQILYFGSPIFKLVAARDNGEVVIVSSHNLRDEFLVIYLTRPRHKCVGLMKWDPTTFLVAEFNGESKSGKVFSYSFRYFGVDHFPIPQQQQQQRLASYDSTELRCTMNFEVVTFILRNDSCEEGKKLRKLESDLFMIDGADRMIFVSYESKQIVKEITQPKSNTICPRIRSKRFDKSVLCIGIDKVQVFSYDTFYITLEFPYSEYVQSEIKKSIESSCRYYNGKPRFQFLAQSFLNPKKLDEEIIVCGCPNFLLFVKIKRGWQGPTEHVLKILNFTCLSLLILKSTYLCVGSKRGLFSLFHMDIPNLEYEDPSKEKERESTYFQRAKKRDGWIDCTPMYQIRKHYNGISGMVVVNDNSDVDEDNIYLTEDFSECLVTSSLDGYLVKNKLKGLNLVRDGRALVEMDRMDVSERTRYLMEYSDEKIIFEGISYTCFDIQLMNQTFEHVFKSFLMSK